MWGGRGFERFGHYPNFETFFFGMASLRMSLCQVAHVLLNQVNNWVAPMVWYLLPDTRWVGQVGG